MEATSLFKPKNPKKLRRSARFHQTLLSSDLFLSLQACQDIENYSEKPLVQLKAKNLLSSAPTKNAGTSLVAS